MGCYTMLMTALQWVNAIIVFLGIPTIAGVLILIGRKLELLDGLKDELRDNIKPDLKDVRERFSALEGKTSGLFQSQSPISLTPKGTEFLIASKLKEYIDSNKELLNSACSQKGSMDTPYDVQQSVFEFFDNFEFPQETEKSLKTYAFDQGASMDALRRIGAIYFRDICLRQSGFSADDLDKRGK
jgi:hypothetical protein